MAPRCHTMASQFGNRLYSAEFLVQEEGALKWGKDRTLIPCTKKMREIKNENLKRYSVPDS